MNKLHTFKTALAISAMFAASGAFADLNKADYNAAKDRISADYKADKSACGSFSGNQKDICVEQAKGKESVARAELEYGNSGKAADANKVAVAKADAARQRDEIAMAKCLFMKTSRTS